MPITYTIDHISSSTESVLVETAPKSEMVSQGTVVDPKTGAKTTSYSLASGDSAYPGVVEYRVEAQNRGGFPILRVSMTFKTWATSDDGLGTVVKRPLVSTFAVNLPADLTIELADFDDLIGNVFSFLYASQSAGARNTGYIQRLLYGSPTVA